MSKQEWTPSEMGQIGGRIRAKTLSPERRLQIAKKASRAAQKARLARLEAEKNGKNGSKKITKRSNKNGTK